MKIASRLSSSEGGQRLNFQNNGYSNKLVERSTLWNFTKKTSSETRLLSGWKTGFWIHDDPLHIVTEGGANRFKSFSNMGMRQSRNISLQDVVTSIFNRNPDPLTGCNGHEGYVYGRGYQVLSTGIPYGTVRVRYTLLWSVFTTHGTCSLVLNLVPGIVSGTKNHKQVITWSCVGDPTWRFAF
jgi:hypothetical protein